MRVFVVPSWHPSPERPHHAAWVAPHVECLREAGHEAYVLHADCEAASSNGAVRQLHEGRLHAAVHAPGGRFRRTRFGYGAVLRAYGRRLRELYGLALARWGRPDVIHAHVSLPAGFGAAELGRAEGVPVVVTEHYSGFESDARFPWRVGAFVRQMGREVRGFYAVSPAYAERIARTGLVRVDGVLPNPVDTELFRPAVRQAAGPFRIVTAGNLSALKGTDVLLGALASLDGGLDWTLAAFGDAGRRADYGKWLDNRALAARVSLPGRVARAELAGAFADADLYVVSSRLETANVSMLEAMACGCAVVSTRCGGPESLIDESVGLTVPAGNPAALAEAIVRSAARRCDRAAQRRYVEDRYSMRAAAALMTAAYERAMQGAA